MTATAVGEVVGDLLERVGTGADLVVVAATPGHAGALEDVVAAVRTLLCPRRVAALVAPALSVPGDDVATGPGLALWSGDLPLARSEAQGGGGLAIGTGRAPPPGSEPTVVAACAGVEVVRVPGERSFGPVRTVTRAERDVVYELDGRPAWEVLLDAVGDHLRAGDLPLVDAGLRLAPVGAPSVGVRGVDRDNGALGLRAPLEVGDPVAFAVRDPAVAAAEVAEVVADRSPAGCLCAHVRGTLLGASLDGVERVAALGWEAGSDLPGDPDAAAVVAVVAPRPRG